MAVAPFPTGVGGKVLRVRLALERHPLADVVEKDSLAIVEANLLSPFAGRAIIARIAAVGTQTGSELTGATGKILEGDVAAFNRGLERVVDQLLLTAPQICITRGVARDVCDFGRKKPNP